jgi:predicted nucleic acid-binding protein
LVKPLRDDDSNAVQDYLFVLRTFPNLKLRSVDEGVAHRAAEMRAKYNIRPPDAIQLGSSLEEGAEAFFTNDRRLRMVREIEVHVLSDYVP